MKSFFEFYRMMEEDGAIPPPASSNQGGSGASSMANPATTMTQDPKQQVPPSSDVSPPVPSGGAVSPPVPDPQEDLKTSLRNFIDQKFIPFINTKKLTPEDTQKFITSIIGEMMKEFDVNKGKVMKAAKQAITEPPPATTTPSTTTPPQGNETKQAPIPPQAS
jgi:hypothetical protein